MDVPPLQRRLRRFPGLAFCGGSLCACFLGCASPGAPRPPSLGLPALVQDLRATRAGDLVDLHFTVPDRTSDDLPLRATTLRAAVCRETAPRAPCTEVPPTEFPKGGSGALHPGQDVALHDHLPLPVREGPARLLGYRLALRTQDGRSAGYSPVVYVPAGSPPPPVTQLTAQGTRAGVLFTWTPVADGGEVLLEREQIGDLPPVGHTPTARTSQRRQTGSGREQHAEQPGTVWLEAHPGDRSAAQTLDSSAMEGVRYRYNALRREQVQLGGLSLEIRSAPSAAVEYTLTDTYPLPAPRGLTAIGFAVSDDAAAAGHGQYAVDLVWEPVSDPRLGGYLVYRRELLPDGEATDTPVQLTPEPLRTPGYHDATAQGARSYRYEVIAVDEKGGDRSPAATATVQASTR